MIDIKQLLPYYPKSIADNATFHKHILKEYVELLALQYLSQSPYAPKLVFIGGTCLRMVYGIDRFSEDLDFDCKCLNPEEFVQMTDSLIVYLCGNGLMAEVRDKENSSLTAFRRNIYFPGLLFELNVFVERAESKLACYPEPRKRGMESNLTGHREERFLMKIEAQDQGVPYSRETAMVNRNGFLFTVSVPSKGVLLSMKLSALLARAKGSDFYDTIFLWQQTEPDFNFLSKRCGISTPQQLKAALNEKLAETNLLDKQKDVQHLLFSSSVGDRIMLFRSFFEERLSV